MVFKNIVIAILLLFSIQLAGQMNRVYVHSSATGNNNGTSWTNAYTDFQTAIDASSVNDTLWLAAGTYIPSYFPASTSSNNTPRDKAFVIVKNLVILGGFVGNETSVSQRDFNTNHTILSGDVNQDDSQNNKMDNLYHVVLMGAVDSATILDGVIIERGYADNNVGSSDYTNALGARDEGAGVNIGGASPIFKNCTFRYNYAKLNGGAVYGIHTRTIFEKCTFFDNSSASNGGTNLSKGGGAIHIYKPELPYINTRLRIYNCSFLSNNGGDGGGAIVARFAPVDIYDCTFDGNSATRGGAINLYDTDKPFKIHNSIFTNNNAHYGGAYEQINSVNGDIYNCQFLNNNAQARGGAISLIGTTVSAFTNCSFIQNSAQTGGVANMSGDHSAFYNCVFSQNTANSVGIVAAVSYNNNSTKTEYINCTFSQNTSINQTGGSALGIFYNYNNCHPKIINCIIWGNTIPEFSNYPLNPSATMTTTNSIIESTNSLNWNTSYGIDGGNNTNDDPQLLNPNINYLRVNSTSPAIDAGINSYNSTATDLALAPRIHNNTIDLGAFEFGTYIVTHQQDTACHGDSILVNNIYLSQTGDYAFPFIDTITGIDSINVVQFTELPVFISFPVVSACNSYSLNGQVFTQSTVIVDTLISSFGCDSIVYLSLDIYNSDTIMLSETICENDSFQVFNNFYDQAGTYIVSGQNINGCDSIVTVNLAVEQLDTTMLNKTICENDVVSVFGFTYSQSGVYTTTGQSINGCDSIVTLDLSVSTVALIDTIVANTGSIDVSLSGDTLNYQYSWSNGATTQDIYQLGTSGIYTLTVTDTIGCTHDFLFELIMVNTNEVAYLGNIKIAPNPATDIININMPFGNYELGIVNTLGQTVLVPRTYINTNERIDIKNLEAGIYFLHIKKGKFVFTEKLVIRR